MILLFTNLFEIILSKDQQRVIAAVSACFIWFKVLDWLRLFDATAFYISLMEETIDSTKFFMIIMGIWYMCFGTAFYIMNFSHSEEIVPTITGIWVLDSFESMYELGLGEFATDGYLADGKGGYLCYLMFLMATFLIQIVFLNMLIAIMGDTFAQATENTDVDARRTKLNIMNEYTCFLTDSNIDELESKSIYETLKAELMFWKREEDQESQQDAAVESEAA